MLLFEESFYQVCNSQSSDKSIVWNYGLERERYISISLMKYVWSKMQYLCDANLLINPIIEFQ